MDGLFKVTEAEFGKSSIPLRKVTMLAIDGL